MEFFPPDICICIRSILEYSTLTSVEYLINNCHNLINNWVYDIELISEDFSGSQRKRRKKHSKNGQTFWIVPLKNFWGVCHSTLRTTKFSMKIKKFNMNFHAQNNGLSLISCAKKKKTTHGLEFVIQYFCLFPFIFRKHDCFYFPIIYPHILPIHTPSLTDIDNAIFLPSSLKIKQKIHTHTRTILYYKMSISLSKCKTFNYIYVTMCCDQQSVQGCCVIYIWSNK